MLEGLESGRNDAEKKKKNEGEVHCPESLPNRNSVENPFF
jgi:hypothetical protein